MNYEYALGQCTNYLLDILDVPPGKLPDRAREHWDDVFKLAVDQKTYSYLAAWMLEYWNDALPEKVKHQFWIDLEWYKARNIMLTQEIIELAKMFREAGIPLMFLKGSAGLVRGLYPLEQRFVSDIDALVPMECINSTRQLLLSNGFNQTHQDMSCQKKHHLSPFHNPAFLGDIEIHVDPYNFCYLDRPAMPDIWDDSDEIIFHQVKVLVPSISDHVWILMRTDSIHRVFLPRLRDAVEMFLILDANHSVDFDLLTERANKANISNIVIGLSYACSKYMGMKPFISFNGRKFKKWEDWTLNYERKVFRKEIIDSVYSLSKTCAAIRFLPSNGVIPRIRLSRWWSRYSYRVYAFLLLRKILLVTGLLKPVKRSRDYFKNRKKANIEAFAKVV